MLAYILEGESNEKAEPKSINFRSVINYLSASYEISRLSGLMSAWIILSSERTLKVPTAFLISYLIKFLLNLRCA